MKPIIKITIENNEHHTQFIGNPIDLLMELTLLCSKNNKILFLMKNAVKMAEIIEKDTAEKAKDKSKKEDNKITENQYTREAKSILADFASLCKENFN